MSRVTQDDRIILNALVDGELPPAQVGALETRLANEPELAAARDEIAATKAALGSLPRPALSSQFVDRIAAIAGSQQATASVPPKRRWRLPEGWRNVAAAIVLTGVVTSSATWFLLLPQSSSFELLVASAHQRSLLSASPVDVLSSDRHTVKPWLDARLGLSPPAPDLAAGGYPLVGGRVEVISQQALPALVYKHNEHTISVIAVPTNAASRAPQNLASGGYNMVEWVAAGFKFVAVSDLEPQELALFASDYLAAVSGPG